MESNFIDVGVLIAGIGVLASGIGYVFRQYNEDRRIARTVLFNLLEIWNVCVARSKSPQQLVDVIFNEYKNACGEVFGADAAKQLDANSHEFDAIAKPILISHCIGALPRLTDEMSKAYLSSLGKLSERFPILAYRISGKEKIQELFKALEDYEAQINLAFEQELKEGETAIALKAAQQLARNSFAKQYVDEIGRDLLRVAWEAGLVNWIRCVFIVRGREKFNKQSLNELRNEFVTILRQMVASNLQSSQEVGQDNQPTIDCDLWSMRK